MASSCAAEPESGAFRREEVGSQGFLARHNRQIFAEGRSFSGNERDRVFLNDGAARFADVSDLSGADSPNDGRAVIAFDADDDGDVDLFVHETQRERHALYRNDFAAPGAFVKLRLRATRGNPEAIGANVVVRAGDRTVAQVLSRGAGFLSCQAPELVFGLGDAEDAVADVLWPGGARERFEGLARGGRYLLVEGEGEPRPFDARPRALPTPKPPGLRVDVGDRVQPFTVATADGAARTLDPAALARAGGEDGRLMLNLWASYCAPCVGELPLLERWNDRPGTSVVAVSVDAPSAQVRAAEILTARAPKLELLFVRDADEGAGERTLHDVVDLARLPLPTTLVLDGDGLVVEIVRGPVEEPR
ncbi:MAG: ASPIC/UnbV domain-containing protein [Planctomycetota bacterium]